MRGTEVYPSHSYHFCSPPSQHIFKESRQWESLLNLKPKQIAEELTRQVHKYFQCLLVAHCDQLGMCCSLLAPSCVSIDSLFSHGNRIPGMAGLGSTYLGHPCFVCVWVRVWVHVDVQLHACVVKTIVWAGSDK